MPLLFIYVSLCPFIFRHIVEGETNVEPPSDATSENGMSESGVWSSLSSIIMTVLDSFTDPSIKPPIINMFGAFTAVSTSNKLDPTPTSIPIDSPSGSMENLYGSPTPSFEISTNKDAVPTLIISDTSGKLTDIDFAPHRKRPSLDEDSQDSLNLTRPGLTRLPSATADISVAQVYRGDSRLTDDFCQDAQWKNRSTTFGRWRPNTIDEQFLWRFNYDNPNCKMLAQFNAALHGKILIQGRLFISTTAIAFHSVFNDTTLISSIPTIVFFELKDVVSIKKKNSLMIFPNMVSFEVKGGEVYDFGSLMRRERVRNYNHQSQTPRPHAYLVALSSCGFHFAVVGSSHDPDKLCP